MKATAKLGPLIVVVLLVSRITYWCKIRTSHGRDKRLNLILSRSVRQCCIHLPTASTVHDHGQHRVQVAFHPQVTHHHHWADLEQLRRFDWGGLRPQPPRRHHRAMPTEATAKHPGCPPVPPHKEVLGWDLQLGRVQGLQAVPAWKSALPHFPEHS